MGILLPEIKSYMSVPDFFFVTPYVFETRPLTLCVISTILKESGGYNFMIIFLTVFLYQRFL